eukprot:scaffold518476_cov149-Attheya_sp.AAC.1
MGWIIELIHTGKRLQRLKSNDVTLLLGESKTSFANITWIYIAYTYTISGMGYQVGNNAFA